jgi:hypothetical protein
MRISGKMERHSINDLPAPSQECDERRIVWSVSFIPVLLSFSLGAAAKKSAH